MFLQPLKSYLFTKDSWSQKSCNQKQKNSKNVHTSTIRGSVAAKDKNTPHKRDRDQRLPDTCLFSYSERDLIRILHHITKALPMAEQYANNASRNQHHHLHEFFSDLKESLEVYSAAGYELLFEHPDFQNERVTKNKLGKQETQAPEISEWGVSQPSQEAL
jgi:hypothetical protein